MAFTITETTKHMDGYDSCTFDLDYVFETYEEAYSEMLELIQVEKEKCEVPCWRSTFRIKDTRYAS